MAVGISLAGPVSPHSEIIASSPFLGWTDVPLVRMVQDRTTLPTVVQNDVRALTAAEHWFGAAAGCRDFALITIGAGVGCGLVMDDRLVDGMSGASGQVGHFAAACAPISLQVPSSPRSRWLFADWISTTTR